jgi:hypothetical protein
MAAPIMRDSAVQAMGKRGRFPDQTEGASSERRARKGVTCSDSAGRAATTGSCHWSAPAPPTSDAARDGADDGGSEDPSPPELRDRGSGSVVFEAACRLSIAPEPRRRRPPPIRRTTDGREQRACEAAPAPGADGSSSHSAGSAGAWPKATARTAVAAGSVGSPGPPSASASLGAGSGSRPDWRGAGVATPGHKGFGARGGGARGEAGGGNRGEELAAGPAGWRVV